MRTLSWSRWGVRPLLALTCLWVAGCASGASLARPAPEALPAGSPLLSRTLADTDAWLRHFLMGERYDSALWVLGPDARLRPRDPLQRDLQLGVVLHEAGRYRESNRAFERAEREADLRYTRSVSRGMGSLLVNDRALAYLPSAAEMLLIPYYRITNYLALGDVPGAVVEARKVTFLLGQREEEQPPCGPGAMMAHLAGLVFAQGGERNDALVALRNAERLYDRCMEAGGAPAPVELGEELFRVARSLGFEELADSARSRYGIQDRDSAGGELIVLVEHGFAAHRSEEQLLLPLVTESFDSVGSEDDEAIAALAAELTEQALLGREAGPAGVSSPATWALMAGGAHVLELAWPSYHREGATGATVQLAAGDTSARAMATTDVSGALIADFERNLPTILLRTVGRGISRYLVSREAERKAGEEGGEAAKWVVGLLTNAVANAMENADTRSWSLLPDRISIHRLRLPPGEFPVRLEISGGGVVRTVDLGTVKITPGERILLSHRVWSERGFGAQAHRTD